MRTLTIAACAAPLLAGCNAAAGDAEGAEPREGGGHAPGRSFAIPDREVVEYLTFAPSLGWHSGGWRAFASAPGQRVIIYHCAGGDGWERAGLIDRPGQVFGAVYWNPVDGVILHGGRDTTILYRADKVVELSRIEGKFVRLIPGGAAPAGGEAPELILTGSGAGGRGAVLRTRDGKALESIAVFEDKDWPKHVADYVKFNNTSFVVGGSEGAGAIFASDDDLHYRKLPLGEIPNLLSIAFDAAGNALAVGDNGECLRSSDGGATWGPTLSGTDKPLASVVFVANKTAFACGREGVVLLTKDAGESFTSIATGRRDDFFRMVKSPAGDGVHLMGARGAAPFVAVE